VLARAIGRALVVARSRAHQCRVHAQVICSGDLNSFHRVRSPWAINSVFWRISSLGSAIVRCCPSSERRRRLGSSCAPREVLGRPARRTVRVRRRDRVRSTNRVGDSGSTASRCRAPALSWTTGRGRRRRSDRSKDRGGGGNVGSTRHIALELGDALVEGVNRVIQLGLISRTMATSRMTIFSGRLHFAHGRPTVSNTEPCAEVQMLPLDESIAVAVDRVGDFARPGQETDNFGREFRRAVRVHPSSSIPTAIECAHRVASTRARRSIELRWSR